MEKLINSYEGMFIVSLANGEEATRATLDKFEKLISDNAEVIRIDEWGKRRFAYPIQDMTDGFYTVVTFKCDGAFPTELQRLMTIDESVLRAMVIRLEYDAAERAKEAPVVAEEIPAEEEEAPAKEAAPAEEEAPVEAAPAEEAAPVETAEE
ncbi:MAG: 30S ribosomal protein S6 [Clostridia bacterium]|nr:30S ribosomal protein S6 [Clostridia bacterium]